MAKSNVRSKVGVWAFLVGIVLAVVLGAFATFLSVTIFGLLVALIIILGLVVGFLNVKGDEAPKFLIAAIALVVVAYMGENALAAMDSIAYVGPILSGILNALLLLFIPATVIVALKTAIKLAKN